MVGCRWMLFRCLLRWIPLVACLVEVVNVSMKSGMARVQGWGTNGGAEEAEASSDFCGEWWAEDIDV